MADPDLVKVLDYILNRCDEASIEAVAAAVVRRRRDLAMFGGKDSLPDPKHMARDLASQIDAGGSADFIRETVRDTALRILQQEAPELSEAQVEALINSWVPGPEEMQAPPGVLAAMIGQFAAYSRGGMDAAEDESLRAQFGAWPERYWKAFPQLVRLIIGEYLRDEIGEAEFHRKIQTALTLKGSGP
ncbi:MAG: hypothetical protein LBQ35_09220 [Spirochaetaceae bacterium]|jgi:hypothetical protein|nr:hypothetical protein [Spirochaetaceae bacterium]